MPKTPLHDAALRMVRDGKLNGFSVEFHAKAERRESGIRVVENAPTWWASAWCRRRPTRNRPSKSRRRGGFRLSGRIPMGRRLTCRCHRGACDVVRFKKGAFDEAMNDPDHDTLLITGTFDSAMASRHKGTLRMKATDDAIEIEADLPATVAADDLAANAANVNLLTRPVFDQDASEFVERDGVAEYSKVRLKAVLVGASDVQGWPAATISGKSARKRSRRLFQTMNFDHIDVGPAPVDLTTGLADGTQYLVQVREIDGAPLLYATAEAAPADLDDWFEAVQGGFFTICGGTSTWARTAGDHTVSGNAEAFAVLALADFEE